MGGARSGGAIRRGSGLVVTVALLVGGLGRPATGRAAASCGGLPATIVGTADDDSLVGTGGSDVIAALGGDDHVNSGDGDDFVCAGSNSGGHLTLGDVVFAGAGDDLVYGGPGIDQVEGESGNDLLLGGARHDWLRGGAGDDVLRGGARGDTLRAGKGIDRSYGGSGGDLLKGDPGRDVEVGGTGSDRFLGGAGDDLIAGGGGWDRLDFDTCGLECPPMRVDLVAGSAEGYGTDGVTGFEAVVTGRGDDVIVATDADELIQSRDGADEVQAGGGDDVVFPGSGDNVVRGGAGNDVIDFLYSSSELYGGRGLDTLTAVYQRGFGRYFSKPVVVDLLAGIASATGAVSTVAGFEAAYGSVHDDTLMGDARDNRLYAGRGTDTVDGRDGTDVCKDGENVANCEERASGSP